MHFWGDHDDHGSEIFVKIKNLWNVCGIKHKKATFWNFLSLENLCLVCLHLQSLTKIQESFAAGCDPCIMQEEPRARVGGDVKPLPRGTQWQCASINRLTQQPERTDEQTQPTGQTVTEAGRWADWSKSTLNRPHAYSDVADDIVDVEVLKRIRGAAVFKKKSIQHPPFHFSLIFKKKKEDNLGKNQFSGWSLQQTLACSHTRDPDRGSLDQVQLILLVWTQPFCAEAGFTTRARPAWNGGLGRASCVLWHNPKDVWEQLCSNSLCATWQRSGKAIKWSSLSMHVFYTDTKRHRSAASIVVSFFLLVCVIEVCEPNQTPPTCKNVTSSQVAR